MIFLSDETNSNINNYDYKMIFTYFTYKVINLNYVENLL